MNSNHPKFNLREPRLKKLAAVLLTIVALAFLAYRNSFEFVPSPQSAASQQRGDEPTSDSRTTNDDSGAKAKPASESSDSSRDAADATKAGAKRSEKDPSSRRPESATESGGRSKPRDQAPRGPPWATGISAEVFEFLEQTAPELYRSPAGLIYGPGSVHGHRLVHVFEHARDDQDKPIHGVFDGRELEILQLIDEAYLRTVNQHPGVSVSVTGQRKAYSVDFERRIGFVGGRTGKRQNRPAARTLVLVLDGERVITAYPKRN